MKCIKFIENYIEVKNIKWMLLLNNYYREYYLCKYGNISLPENNFIYEQKVGKHQI